MRVFITLITAFSVFVLQAQQADYKAIKNVLLKISDKDNEIKRVALDTSQIEFGGYFMDESNDEKGNLKFNFHLDKPKLYQINSVIPFCKRNELYITPGDTLSFYLDKKNNYLVFEGKNAAHYNYFNKLNNAVPDNFLEIIKDKQPKEINYKEILEGIYNKRILFLENYVNTEKLSEGFYLKMKEYHFLEYANSLINTYYVPKVILEAHPEYFQTISISSFNRDEMLDCWSFKTNLIEYLNHSTNFKAESHDFTSEKLQHQLNFIENNLTGNVKQYAITKTLLSFYKNLTPATIDPLKKAMQLYISKFTVQNYKTILEYYLKPLEKKQNAQIPEAVLNSKFYDLNGTTLSFKEILELNKEKIKILDFWASWCFPCIEGIKKSYPYRNPIAKEKNLQFIYISLDDDANKWKKRIELLHEFGMKENQYRVSKEDQEKVREYFNCHSIPKSCLINRHNEMVTFEMSMPWETENFNTWLEKAEGLK